jgi:transposase
MYNNIGFGAVKNQIATVGVTADPWQQLIKEYKDA